MASHTTPGALAPHTSEADTCSPVQETASISQQAPPNEVPIILIGLNGLVLTINASAARIFGLTIKQVKGQPLSNLMGGALAALSHQLPESRGMHLVQSVDGETLLARSGPVVGRNNQVLGYAIIFEERSISPAVREAASPAAAEAVESPPTLATLRRQIQTMNELIGMLPVFSHNKYWQNLLVEHMERLIKEMTAQVQQIDALSA